MRIQQNDPKVDGGRIRDFPSVFAHGARGQVVDGADGASRAHVDCKEILRTSRNNSAGTCG